MNKLGEFSVGIVKIDEGVGPEYEVCTEEEIDFYCNHIRNTYVGGLHIISNEDMFTAIKAYRIMKRNRGEFKEMDAKQKQDFMKKESEQNIAKMLSDNQR